jgi:uncharacterized lipoprotein YddW (UPF0748 family)
MFQREYLHSNNIFPIFLIIILLNINLCSQSLSPKREFRGIWIATVENIDWPSQKNLTTEQQKNEFIDIIDRLKKDKFNAIFIQIRPSCDAFYQSSLEPWSEWLTGKQGIAPQPFYDPLKFIIEECHKRAIEVHAWLNPFRSVMDIHSSNISANHVSRLHPAWNVAYGQFKWLNPGLPQVRDYVLQVVMDVVNRYNIDGIHFDDYFYPYQIPGKKFHDEKAYSQYSHGIKNLEDWRRDNINLFIKSVSENIKRVKPEIKFGVSPFGIWKNKSSDPAGSLTSGSESFNSTYSDSRKWLREGWVDYVAPQLYWNIGNRVADYKSLAEWWNNNSFGKNIYLGQSIYKIGTDKNPAWHNGGEIPFQIKLNRNLDHIKGNVFFNTNSYLKNPFGLEDSVRNNYYKYYAVSPQVTSYTSSNSLTPISSGYQNLNGKILLNWQKPIKGSNVDSTRNFIIYRFDGSEPIDISRSDKIKDVLWGSETSWLDTRKFNNSLASTYVITSLNKFGNESSDNCRIFVPVVTIAGNLNITNPNYLQINENKTGLEMSIKIASSGFIRLSIFDISGKLIKTIFYGYKKEGSYNFELPGNEINEKIIIVQLRTSGYYSSQKIKLN